MVFVLFYKFLHRATGEIHKRSQKERNSQYGPTKVCVRPVAHTAEAYFGFCSIKQLGVFLLPLDGMLVHHRLPPPLPPLAQH